MDNLKEFSAGGLIVEDGKLLIVFMHNLSGKNVWTFPKGHIEKGETNHTAALREVFEETGIKCEIIDNREFYISEYSFHKNGHNVDKKVYWYLMKPVEKTGKILTPQEILNTLWVNYDQAIEKLEYKSDKEILKKLKYLNLVK